MIKLRILFFLASILQGALLVSAAYSPEELALLKQHSKTVQNMVEDCPEGDAQLTSLIKKNKSFGDSVRLLMPILREAQENSDAIDNEQTLQQSTRNFLQKEKESKKRAEQAAAVIVAANFHGLGPVIKGGAQALATFLSGKQQLEWFGEKPDEVNEFIESFELPPEMVAKVKDQIFEQCPDAILVHSSIAHEFIEKFNAAFSSTKTGDLDDPLTMIPPIARLSELQKFAAIFHKNKNDILSGGTIDFKHNIVAPTTIVRAIERSPNYKEMFGPVAFIHPYASDSDLSYYFKDPDGQYNSHRMYVTVYGDSAYVSKRDDAINPNNPGNVGIVLNNQTIHDVEIGYKPYGGYSLGASHIVKKTADGTQKIAMPILIPQIISDYLINGKALPFKKSLPSQHTHIVPVITSYKEKELEPINQDFKILAQTTFGDNLLFGFIFGSAAKGSLKANEHRTDDLDTFICLAQSDEAAMQSYLESLAILHEKYHLKVDDQFPAEIMTIKELEQTIQSLDNMTISIDEKITGKKFDHIFWAHALTDKKIAFIGNGQKMQLLIRGVLPHIKKWSNEIISQMKNKDSLPDHVSKKFSGLNKEQVIEKLLSYKNPHLIVHLGLRYDDGTA